MNALQPPIRVVIAEDNPDLSAALGALVEQEPDMQLVATVDRCDRLPEVLRNGTANVVVLDLNLGGQSSVAPMRAIRQELPELAVVIYSGYDFGDIGSALPSLGACEYVSKSGDAATLLAAIRRAANGTAGAGN
jgi:DNA-binding NarL/FixJ family response regulator